MREPSFVGVGFQKCGSSSLYKFLRHAGAAALEKELHFFRHRGAKQSRKQYLECFESAGEAEFFGEFTPDYLYNPRALVLLASWLDTTKFLVVLRNPIDRFYSAANHARGIGKISPEWSAVEILERALQGREPYGWLASLVSKGFLGEHLSTGLEILPKERVHVSFLEELVSPETGRASRESVCHFLDMEAPIGERPLPAVNNARHQLKGESPLVRSSLADSALRQIYRPSSRVLEQVLGRKLPWSF